MSDEAIDQLGTAIDDVESLLAGLDIPMSAEFHIKQLKAILPDKIKELKLGFIGVTGENPWQDGPFDPVA